MSSINVAEYIRLNEQLAECDAACANEAECDRLAERIDTIWRHLDAVEVAEVERYFAKRNGEKEDKESTP